MHQILLTLYMYASFIDLDSFGHKHVCLKIIICLHIQICQL